MSRIREFKSLASFSINLKGKNENMTSHIMLTSGETLEGFVAKTIYDTRNTGVTRIEFNILTVGGNTLRFALEENTKSRLRRLWDMVKKG